MGFFRSILRFFATLFGLAEGTTERATDAMLTASADTIRSQFRKTREDAINSFNNMKDAIAQLITIRDDKAATLQSLNKKSVELDNKMKGAIDSFKKNNDPRLREAYAKFAEERESTETKIDELEIEIADQDKIINGYKLKLKELQANIDKLKTEEAETIADIVSSRQINELNAKLEGLSTDTQTKNLDAIREARKKAKASAKLSNDLSNSDNLQLETELVNAGIASKHADVFDSMVKLDSVFSTPAKEISAPRDLSMLETLNNIDSPKEETKTADCPIDSMF